MQRRQPQCTSRPACSSCETGLTFLPWEAGSVFPSLELVRDLGPALTNRQTMTDRSDSSWSPRPGHKRQYNFRLVLSLEYVHLASPEVTRRASERPERVGGCARTPTLHGPVQVFLTRETSQRRTDVFSRSIHVVPVMLSRAKMSVCMKPALYCNFRSALVFWFEASVSWGGRFCSAGTWHRAGSIN